MVIKWYLLPAMSEGTSRHEQSLTFLMLDDKIMLCKKKSVKCCTVLIFYH